MKTTSQRHDDDLRTLLNRCAALKTRLVEFAQSKYLADVQAQIAERSRLVVQLSEWDVAGAIDDAIHEKDSTGHPILDDFANNAPGLSEEDRAIVLGWRESLWGVFEVRGHQGPLLETTNLVDNLDYPVATTMQDRKSVEQLAQSGFLVSRIDRLGDIWTLSGMQSVVKDRRLACGMAAKFAMENPRLFFRNPANLEKAQEADRINHERFVAMFGSAWLVGSPSEIELRYNELLQFHSGPSGIPIFRLPPALHEVDSVGAFSDPIEGVSFFPHAETLLRALEDPSVLADESVRAIVFDYLQMPGDSPHVFWMLAQDRPDQLDTMMAALLDRPKFAWTNDGEGLVREHNPEYFDREIQPSNLPLSEELADGLRAWQGRGQPATPKHQVKPKQRDKNKRAKAARRKNRR